MKARKLPKGMRVQCTQDDGAVHEATVVKTIDGFGYAVITPDGTRKRYAADQVKAWPI